MDNNDFYYILMSSLKHPYREHMTKESTSLLMKELDQAASSAAHHAADHHHGHQQSTSNSAATSSGFLGHRHHQRRWDGLKFGSPKSPENVARTILKALGADEKDSATGNAASTSGRDVRRRSTSSGSISQSAPPVHSTNGHHQHFHLRQTSYLHQHQTSSSILSRCRRRLHLQLTKANGTGAGSSPPPNPEEADGQRTSRRPLTHSKRPPQVVLATNGDCSRRHHENYPSSISEGATPSSLPPPACDHKFVSRTVPATVDAPSRIFVVQEPISAPGPGSSSPRQDEHQLIAFNSSLLMVKPVTDAVNGGGHDSGGESSSSEESSGDSFAPPPPPATACNEDIPETAILDSDTSQSRGSSTAGHRRPYFPRRDSEEGRVLIEHHPPPVSLSQQELHKDQPPEAATPSGTLTSTELEPSPDLQHAKSGSVGLAVVARAMSSSDSTPATGSSLQRIHNRLCTSYRLKISQMKNPVDLCLLPNDDIAIADYDNGLLIVNDLGEVVEHKKTFHEVNACGVACVRGGSCSPSFRIFLLVVRDGVWTINVYRNFDLVEMARCPTDAQIENWALRRLVVCDDTRLHLMASGETKSTIWTYEFEKGEWRVLLTECSGGRKTTSGNYNDMSVKVDKGTRETRLVLCEWKKAQLWTLFLNEKTDVMEEKSIKMKRVKGQEWIIQGPHLATLDEQADILVYDGSGKLFLFDGDSYRCKKIVADLGRGEVSAMMVADGWVYALYRYKRCVEAYMYRENSETNI